MKAKFITLEGLEGTGKSTQTAEIANYLCAKGAEVYITQEPGGTQLGEKIRQWLLDPKQQIVEISELLLFYAARMQHIEQRIKPALKKGQWVICDRFMDSSYAYQGGGRNIRLDYIEQLNQMAVPIEPDLTILLDMSPNCIWKRINTNDLDRFEQEDMMFFEQVRNAYLQCADSYPRRIKVVDAEQDIAQVTEMIIGHLKPLVEQP